MRSNDHRLDAFGRSGRCCAGAFAAFMTTAALAGPIPIEDPIPGPIPMTGARIALEPLATELTAPNWGISAPGHPNRLIVTDQPGTLWAIDLTTGEKSVFLDVSDRLVPMGAFGPGTFDERGLLGVAFHPDYMSNGLLYTYESHPDTQEPDFSTMPLGVDPNHQTVVTEWTVPDPTNPESVVDPNSARELLRIDQPQFNHNAGAMNFGHDGLLYIALGDGGAADDQGDGHHETIGNGQEPANILGSIIRIDPQGNNSLNGNYGIPEDNPFVNTDNVEEIFAYGFRNPFRFSFDSATGTLWVGDVGQNDIEEIDIVTKGGNFGWRVKEGTFLFDPNGDMPGFVFENSPGEPRDMIDPVAQYDHDEGVAVLGGFVYHGSAIPQLAGKYVFGEFSDGDFGRLFHLDHNGDIVEFRLTTGPFELQLLGIGQDAAGELYALANETGTPFESTGVVLRIDPGGETGDLDFDGDVDAADLALLLGAWSLPPGSPGCGGSQPCDADLNGDGLVNASDLALLLGNWTIPA